MLADLPCLELHAMGADSVFGAINEGPQSAMHSLSVMIKDPAS